MASVVAQRSNGIAINHTGDECVEAVGTVTLPRETG
jgi:hypothetical protein